MKRVLIVEDEALMARMLARVLREEGYAAETAGDGRCGFARATDDSFDLLILDWMLPDRSGIQIVRGLRAAAVGTPVLMLTARGQVEDRVEGLDAGADDYLSKPFALPELLARVRALTRRPQAEPAETTVRAGDLVLDPVLHVVRRGDEEIHLTAKEFALLHTLVRRRGASSRARSCSTPSGEPPARFGPTRSRSTSPTSGRSSTGRASPPSYAPSAAWATPSGPDQRPDARQHPPPAHAGLRWHPCPYSDRLRRLDGLSLPGAGLRPAG